MANMQECIDTLRRRIGDTEETYTYTDELLIGYIGDAVNEVELDYNRGIIVEFGTFADDITPQDVVLFCAKAHFLMTLRTKDLADRNNFRMVKGRLTLDNTNQSKDHAETLAILSKEYMKILFRVKSGGGSIKGMRVE
jgi:hypothetical protein